ncbi:MAG: polysialyltransferase family glycosyltransferase [Campylobacterota bacterium]|nr:polysialyltransferase family glycosyltransferase [Campylobacterota bacterium]
MLSRKHLFICSTPFQLMAAINLSLTSLVNDEVTLYILDHSDSYNEMYNGAMQAQCFHQIFLLKTKAFNNHWTQKFKVTRYIVKGIEYINHKKIALNFIEDNTNYDKFWVSFMDRSSWLIFLTYKKVNPNIELFFIGDGVGGYRLLTVRENHLDKKLLHILGFKSTFEEMQALYVYEPDLAKNTLYPEIKINPLPKVCDNKIKDILNDILSFDVKDLELLRHKYIFLEAPYAQDKIYNHQLKIMRQLCEQMEDQFCIKLHPRTLMKEVDDQKCISNVTTAIEALCLNGDVSKNVFISGLSAASVMPKLMFDQEPVVIFLYKIFELDKLTFS